MSRLKLRVIINPRSGPARQRADRRRALAAALGDLGLPAECVETRGPGDAVVLARSALADGCTGVVAVGGDGTVNEIAGAVAGTPAFLALVPAGSGNGLARHVGIPLEPAGALALLRPGAGRPVAIDVGTANGHLFVNAMGLGFDAEVAARFHRSPQRGLGGYMRTAWRAWREHRPEACRIEADGEAWSQAVWLLTVANSAQYGNNVRIAPGARVADGRLDLVAVLPPSLPALARLGVRLQRGSLLRDPGVQHRAGAAFRITRPAPGLIHVDGETRSTDAVVAVEVHPQRLNLWVPVGGRGDERWGPESAAGN